MRSRLMAAAVLATAATFSLPAVDAQAMPVAQPLPLAQGTPAVTLTSGGCGPFAHRGFYGYCRPNGYGYGPRFGWHRWGWHRWGWHRGWHRW